MAQLDEKKAEFLDNPFVGIATTLREDGSPHSTVVWVDVEDDGTISFNTAAGRAKPRHLEKDPRVSLIVAENEHPYRAMEVRGHATVTTDGYRADGFAIVERYVRAFDPTAAVEAYLSDAPGAIVTIEAESTRAWDYSDEEFV